ncbi:MAG: hypothetical protein WCS17_10965 [Prevotella sp.]
MVNTILGLQTLTKGATLRAWLLPTTSMDLIVYATSQLRATVVRVSSRTAKVSGGAAISVTTPNLHSERCQLS